MIRRVSGTGDAVVGKAQLHQVPQVPLLDANATNVWSCHAAPRSQWGGHPADGWDCHPIPVPAPWTAHDRIWLSQAARTVARATRRTRSAL